MADLRRSAVTLAILLLVAGLFLATVAKVILSAVVGIVAGLYMRPVYRAVLRRVDQPHAAAVLAQAVVLVPAAVVLTYGYVEIRRAARYLSENTAEVAARLEAALASLPFDSTPSREGIERTVDAAATYAVQLPEEVREALAGFMVATSVFLFTAHYVLAEAPKITATLRRLVPSRYAPLSETLEANARGALHGAVYATMIAQLLKGGLMLALNLALGVPLPFTLALLAFIIGFFPIVGSWTVYVPVAAYLAVFEESLVRAAIMLAVGFFGSTIFIALYLRPKLAAEHSRVLDFYWMFLGLVAGVYTFGLPGIIVGPIVIAMLKAVLDTLTTPDVWDRGAEPGQGEARAEVLVKEELEATERAAAGQYSAASSSSARRPAR